MAGNHRRGFPPPCPVHVGGGPRAKSHYCNTTLAGLEEKTGFLRFREQPGVFVTWQRLN
jgi:hypothetical protein